MELSESAKQFELVISPKHPLARQIEDLSFVVMQYQDSKKPLIG